MADRSGHLLPKQGSKLVLYSGYSLLCLCLLLSFTLPWLQLANNRDRLDLTGFEYLGRAFVDQLDADTVYQDQAIDPKQPSFPFQVQPVDRVFYLLPLAVWLLAVIGLWWRRRLLLTLAIYGMYLHMVAGWWGFWMSTKNPWSTLWPALLGTPLLVLTLNEVRGQIWRAKNPSDGRTIHFLGLMMLVGLALLYAIVHLIVDNWPDNPTLLRDYFPLGLCVLLLGFAIGTSFYGSSKLGRLPNRKRLWLAHGGLYVLAFVPYIIAFQDPFLIFFSGRYQIGMVLFCVILGVMMMQAAITEAWSGSSHEPTKFDSIA